MAFEVTTSSVPQAHTEAARRAFFEQRLPIYRLSMHMAAINLSDLNEDQGLRRAAMVWFSNDDEGLASLNEVSDVIATFHQAALAMAVSREGELPEDVLRDEEGRSYGLEDLVTPEAVKAALIASSGIWEDLENREVLVNSGNARKARTHSANSLINVCSKVGGIIHDHFEHTPSAPRAQRPRIITPTSGPGM